MKRILGWAVVAFIAYYLFSDPSGAAGNVHSLLGIARQAGTSLATFFSSLGGA